MCDLEKALQAARVALSVPRRGALSHVLRDLVYAVEEKLDDANRGWT